MNGLCKWGESELVVRQRVLPAGIPKEIKFATSGPPDPTWKKAFVYFETKVQKGETSYFDDLFMSQALVDIKNSYEKK